jgi:hypothetical protein
LSASRSTWATDSASGSLPSAIYTTKSWQPIVRYSCCLLSTRFARNGLCST